MAAVSAVVDNSVRPLAAGDVERVIAIDRSYSGHSRHHFFEKRLAAAAAHPDDYIHIGAVRGGSLRGFVIARVLRGEFGHEHTVAVLDSIGVEPESRERGIGQALMAELGRIMRRLGVRSLQSQADWTNHDLLRFFAAAGFTLAPRLVLQRRVDDLLVETSDDV
jgi:L-amino acid N-acyltransferase YncA